MLRFAHATVTLPSVSFGRGLWPRRIRTLPDWHLLPGTSFPTPAMPQTNGLASRAAECGGRRTQPRTRPRLILGLCVMCLAGAPFRCAISCPGPLRDSGQRRRGSHHASSSSHCCTPPACCPPSDSSTPWGGCWSLTLWRDRPLGRGTRGPGPSPVGATPATATSSSDSGHGAQCESTRHAFNVYCLP